MVVVVVVVVVSGPSTVSIRVPGPVESRPSPPGILRGYSTASRWIPTSGGTTMRRLDRAVPDPTSKTVVVEVF